MMDERTSASRPRPGPAPGLDALLDDQSGCWRRGERLPVEAYLEFRPDLRQDEDQVLDLIYHEILLRTRAGDAPKLREYLQRFPQYGSQLRAQFDLHQAVLLGESLLATRPPPEGYGEPAGPAGPPDVPGYEILGELGRGGMGVVYRARQKGLDRLVALKMIRGGAGDRPGQVARFRSEAQALARLEHPHIIRIYEVGEHEGRPYFALEHVTGLSLEERLQGAPQPPREAAALLETLARAVHAAHECRIVHRDLKPANVLLAEPRPGALPPGASPGGDAVARYWGTPKITDFGLAKQLDADSLQTRDGDILGTPSYMAPEQAGRQPGGPAAGVGPAVDVYALGAILYECLTGRPPFLGQTLWDTLEQVVKQEPVPPRQLQPKVPRDLETVCLKCLHKEPRKRYDSAQALANDLRRFLAGEPVWARPAPAWERAWKWLRRRPRGAAAGATALLLSAALVAAHYAHLRAALAQARAAAAVAEADRLLDGVETEINAGGWAQAQDRLGELASAKLDAAQEALADPAPLARLHNRAEALRARIARGLTHRERMDQFRADLLDGRMLAALGGVGGEAARGRAREGVGRALSLLHAEVAPAAGPLLHSPYVAGRERAEVVEGCGELLLYLAEATAGPARGGRDGRRRAEEALAVLDRAAGLGVAPALLAGRRARYLSRAGREDEGRREQGRAAEAGPHKPFAFFLRGTDLFREGRLAEAIDQFEKALAGQPDHCGARYALAVCHLKLPPGKDDRLAHVLLARDHLKQCTDQAPDQVWPFLQLGAAQAELGNAAAAEAAFGQAGHLLDGRPDETALYALLVNRGVSRLRRDDLKGAVADLTGAVRLKPDEYPAYLNLAKAYEEQQDWRAAGAQLDRAAALKGSAGLAAVYRSRARLHQHQHDLGAAVRDLEQAVRHEPDGPGSRAAAADRLALARLLLEGGKPREALAEADAARGGGGGRPALRLRAEALLHLGRSAEAVEALGGYLAAGRGGRGAEAPVYLARAQACAAVGRYVEAADDYTCALELEPANVAARTGRGWAYVVLEAPAQALRDFEEAVRLDPENGDAHNGRGYARARVGRHREAVADAEEALRLGPRRPRTLYNAARTFAQAALKAEADPAEGPRGREARARYQDRALGLLRQALELLPAGQRAAFWENNVARDAGLNPLRSCPGFLQLAEALRKSAAAGPAE
jgi:tetratricopeptide (TPR) repeat protein